jgi:uncharacterized pyridoxamine 5'-phosphate oxidase family protein
MKEVYEYLKAAGVYYLATTDGTQPRVRPFGTIDEFDGKLCIQTGKKKDVAKQLMANPKAELSAMAKDGKTWIRIACTLKEDDRREARKHMLDAYPDLRAMYSEDDGNTVIFAMQSAVATIWSFTAAPKEIRF